MGQSSYILENLSKHPEGKRGWRAWNWNRAWRYTKIHEEIVRKIFLKLNNQLMNSTSSYMFTVQLMIYWRKGTISQTRMQKLKNISKEGNFYLLFFGQRHQPGLALEEILSIEYSHLHQQFPIIISSPEVNPKSPPSSRYPQNQSFLRNFWFFFFGKFLERFRQRQSRWQQRQAPPSRRRHGEGGSCEPSELVVVVGAKCWWEEEREFLNGKWWLWLLCDTVLRWWWGQILWLWRKWTHPRSCILFWFRTCKTAHLKRKNLQDV